MIEGNAIIYCQGAFNTPGGKTTHGLVRFTRRYKVLSVIDANYAGQDAGVVLDDKKSGIPVVASLEDALENARKRGERAQFLVIGMSPEGERLSKTAREDIRHAINKGLNIDSGLHDFLSEDHVLMNQAINNDTKIRDIRKPPKRKDLHFFTGKIEEVKSLKIAILGTDSSVGIRTSAWIIVQGLEKAGIKTNLIGTSQTSWMQGARYSIPLCSIFKDFIAGEIENIVHECWVNEQPEVMILEGQGSLMNPAKPEGYELLAAGRADYVILQHAPKRSEYDGCPGHKIHPLADQVKAIEGIFGKKVIAITINHEGLTKDEVPAVCNAIKAETGIPAFDVLLFQSDDVVRIISELRGK
ncbi:MAG: DUF1611 domain-containing protein [Bacteroidales bacterium]|nr:DUF1611 domain-containing protein [Bacteroidales bacterium]